MRCGRRAVLPLIVFAGAAVLTACGGADDDGPFGYDADAPLEIRRATALDEVGLRVRYLTYASPKGGRVPAVVAAPQGRGPFAGVIVQHGMPSSKEDVLGVVRDFARLGAVVVAIDAPFARRTGEPVAFTERDRVEQVQLIVDLR